MLISIFSTFSPRIINNLTLLTWLPSRDLNRLHNHLPSMSDEKSPDNILASKVKALEKTVARLTAEKEEAVSQLDSERKAKEEAVARLDAERKAKEVKNDATLQARRRRADATSTSFEPLDPDNPTVRRVGPNMLNENSTINNCRTDITIHEEPQVFLEALLGDQPKPGKMLFQKVVEEGVAYWSSMVNTTTCCHLLLRMWVERQDEAEVVIRVESVDEEGERGE